MIPKNVKIAVWIFYFTQVIGLVRQYFYYAQVDLKVFLLDKIPYEYKQIIPKEQLEQMMIYYEYAIYALTIVSFLGMIYVVFETSRGKNWARILLLISCILTYVFVFGSMIFALAIGASYQGLSEIFAYRIIIPLLEIFALILLFSKKSKPYFAL